MWYNAKAVAKAPCVLYLFLFIYSVVGVSGAFASSFGTIVVQSECFQIRAELNTGSMDDPHDEAEEIADWQKRSEPIIKDLVAQLSLVLEQFVDVHGNLPLAPYNPEAPELWEESISRDDIPDFLEDGNDICIYKMRFFPFLVADTITISICFSSLPEREVRELLKGYTRKSLFI